MVRSRIIVVRVCVETGCYWTADTPSTCSSTVTITLKLRYCNVSKTLQILTTKPPTYLGIRYELLSIRVCVCVWVCILGCQIIDRIEDPFENSQGSRKLASLPISGLFFRRTLFLQVLPAVRARGAFLYPRMETFRMKRVTAGSHYWDLLADFEALQTNRTRRIPNGRRDDQSVVVFFVLLPKNHCIYCEFAEQLCTAVAVVVAVGIQRKIEVFFVCRCRPRRHEYSHQSKESDKAQSQCQFDSIDPIDCHQCQRNRHAAPKNSNQKQRTIELVTELQRYETLREVHVCDFRWSLSFSLYKQIANQTNISFPQQYIVKLFFQCLDAYWIGLFRGNCEDPILRNMCPYTLLSDGPL